MFLKKIAFFLFSALMLLFFIFSCFPVLKETFYCGQERSITPDKIIYADVSDYISIRMNAKNTGNIINPKSSFSVNIILENFSNENKSASLQYRQEFYIDGLDHFYYIPVGEYKRYVNGADSETSGNVRNTIREIIIEIPDINGVKIELSGVEFNKRKLFPLDSYINYFFKNHTAGFYAGNYVTVFNSTGNVFRFFTPAYVFIICCLIISGFYKLLIHTAAGKNKPDTPFLRSVGFLRILIMMIIIVPLFFSFSFMSHSIFTVKSYWDSYKGYILDKKSERTYTGFYNFRLFTEFIDENAVAGHDIIVPVKGEPVYIMSELAYNLYPRDIKFLNTSEKLPEQIVEEILEIKKSGTYSNRSYKYLLILSDDYLDVENIKENKSFEFIASYRENAGFLFKIVN